MCNKHHELHVEISPRTLNAFLRAVKYAPAPPLSSALWSHMMSPGKFGKLLLNTFMFASSHSKGIRVETLAEKVRHIHKIHFRVQSGKGIRKETSVIFGNLRAVSDQIKQEEQLQREEAFRNGGIQLPA